jgi:hypothetical protein
MIMHIDGTSPSIRPAPTFNNQAHRQKQVKSERTQNSGRTAEPVKLSKAEQTVLKQLFSPSVSPSQRYQTLDQTDQRVRLGQYIDTKA